MSDSNRDEIDVRDQPSRMEFSNALKTKERAGMSPGQH